MSGKHEHARRREQHRERHHERHREQLRQALNASPLPAAEQARLKKDAAYMLARLRGEAARPPAHWPPEQVAAFAALLADPAARPALLNEALRGFQRQHARADALPELPDA